jgi:hypothetical protein
VNLLMVEALLSVERHVNPWSRDLSMIDTGIARTTPGPSGSAMRMLIPQQQTGNVSSIW